MFPSRNSTFGFIKFLGLTLFITSAMIITLPVSADSFYGPVQPNDTLSRIMKRVYIGKSPRMSIMQEIVRANPEAFLGGDMNRLKLNASLILPGDLWINSSQIPKQANTTRSAIHVSDLVDRSAPSLTEEQMKGRIVFLDAERSSLIEQVKNLKQETLLLENKVQKLEAESKRSDEQLRILDAEIIRLTAQLNKQKNDSIISNADLNQLVVLQEKLRLLQNEMGNLKNNLTVANNKLASNEQASKLAGETILQLTDENQRLQKLLQDTQPGVHYFKDTAKNDKKLSFMSGRFELPLGLLVIGVAFIVLILTALISTRRKRKHIEDLPLEDIGPDPFADNAYGNLLETEAHDNRGFAQSLTKPEENVFKMFDEGSLEMDLKLDMAEAYLQVSDFDSARNILKEIVEGGSELQKRKATRLISKLAA